MENNNSKCVWIGIGVELTNSQSIYSDCILINKYLFNKKITSSHYSKDEPPHLNLYDLDIKTNNFSQSKIILKNILKDRKSFYVKVKSIEYFPFGLFFIELEKNHELIQLHELVVKNISELKGNCVNPSYLEPHRSYNSEQKLMLNSFGNPHVLQQFRPHITLGFITDKKADLDAVKKKLNGMLKTDKIKVDKITLVTENNAGRKILEVVELIDA